MSDDGSREKDRPLRNLTGRSTLIGLGWQIATTLLVFTLGGYALDRWLDTLPWFLLTGAIFGLVGVFVQIFRVANELDREEKETRKQKSEIRNQKEGDRIS